MPIVEVHDDDQEREEIEVHAQVKGLDQPPNAVHYLVAEASVVPCHVSVYYQRLSAASNYSIDGAVIYCAQVDVVDF